jgi:hypothetical protein
MNRAVPEESRGGPINYSDADWDDLGSTDFGSGMRCGGVRATATCRLPHPRRAGGCRGTVKQR